MKSFKVDDLPHCGLTHSDLAHCDLDHCDLTHCDLTHCDLAHCDLAYCDLTQSKSEVSLEKICYQLMWTNSVGVLFYPEELILFVSMI